MPGTTAPVGPRRNHHLRTCVHGAIIAPVATTKRLVRKENTAQRRVLKLKLTANNVHRASTARRPQEDCLGTHCDVLLVTIALAGLAITNRTLALLANTVHSLVRSQLMSAWSALRAITAQRVPPGPTRNVRLVTSVLPELEVQPCVQTVSLLALFHSTLVQWL